MVDTNDKLRSLAVLLPARDPDAGLALLAGELSAAGFGAVIVLNDGSASTCDALFERVAAIPGVTLLQHAINLGKGRALKSGINHVLAHTSFLGLVTADADGQHTARDIVRVAEAFLADQTRVALGSRAFQQNVPLRSKFGNLLTRQIFAFTTGTRISDTQSGLRAFPRSVLPQLLPLEGERYEYEMTVLAHLCRTGPRPLELPIETIYIDGNKSSHFDPILDSMRIYFVLVRFYLSSMIAAAIDFAFFALAFLLTQHLLGSILFGRLSSLVNFALNRRFVFQAQGGGAGPALGRYYLLACGIAAMSYCLIWLLTVRAGWPVFVAKLAVDIPLSLVSFSVQRTFVFRRPETA